MTEAVQAAEAVNEIDRAIAEYKPEAEAPAAEPEALEPVDDLGAGEPEGVDFVADAPGDKVGIRKLREYTKRKEQEAAELKSKLDQVTGYLMAQQKLLAPKAEEPEPEPGYLDRFDQDPATTMREFFARVDHARHRTAAQQAEERQRQQQFAQFDQRFAQVAQAIAPLEAEFRAQAPDYDQGVIYATKELAERFVADGNPPEIAARMAKYEMARQAEDASRRGQNPARRLYALAQAWGYEGAAQAPVSTEIDRRERANRAGNPLSAPGSRSATAAPRNLDELIAMQDKLDGDTFDKHFKQFLKY